MLEAHNGYIPEEALRNLVLRHAEQRANALSLVVSPTTFVYLLMVSL
jgi:hypothetical protein